MAQDPTVTITESDPEAKLSETGFNQGGLNGGLIEVKRDLDVTMSCYVENKQIDTLVSSKVDHVSTVTVGGIFHFQQLLSDKTHQLHVSCVLLGEVANGIHGQ